MNESTTVFLIMILFFGLIFGGVLFSLWLDHKKEMKILELAEEWVKQEDD